MLLKLSKYYNAKITVENDRDGGIIQFFIRKGELARLMGGPTTTMDKFIPGTKTNRRAFGHSMSTVRHKQVGEDLLYEWLDARGATTNYFDVEDGEKYSEEEIDQLVHMTKDRLEDQVLIDQLINYERGGNYDVVMAMMGIVVQLKEWYDPELDEPDDGTDMSSQVHEWYIGRYGSTEEKIKILRNKNI